MGNENHCQQALCSYLRLGTLVHELETPIRPCIKGAGCRSIHVTECSNDLADVALLASTPHQVLISTPLGFVK